VGGSLDSADDLALELFALVERDLGLPDTFQAPIAHTRLGQDTSVPGSSRKCRKFASAARYERTVWTPCSSTYVAWSRKAALCALSSSSLAGEHWNDA
jgi:hypothetical protein